MAYFRVNFTFYHFYCFWDVIYDAPAPNLCPVWASLAWCFPVFPQSLLLFWDLTLEVHSDKSHAIFNLCPAVTISFRRCLTKADGSAFSDKQTMSKSFQSSSPSLRLTPIARMRPWSLRNANRDSCRITLHFVLLFWRALASAGNTVWSSAVWRPSNSAPDSLISGQTSSQLLWLCASSSDAGMPAVQRHRSMLHVRVFLDCMMVLITTGHNP
jgi:hypothetical protein